MTLAPGGLSLRAVSTFRRREMCTRTVLAAVGGALSPQSSSTSRSVLRVSLACTSKSARRARCLLPRGATSSPCSSTSSGPRMWKSICRGERGLVRPNVHETRHARQALLSRLYRAATPVRHDRSSSDSHRPGSRRCARPPQEAVMAQAVPTQHPAVVLRSHYRQVRALLAIAMIALGGLTVAG